MGVLQFGWLGVNAFFAGLLLCAPWEQGVGTPAHVIVSTVWAVAAAFMGLKGIQYVARVATFLPLIPLAILLILFIGSVGGLGSFDSQALVATGEQTEVEVRQSEFVRQRVPEAEALSVQRDESGVTTTTYRTHWVEVEKSQVLATKGPLAAWQVIALICTYVVGFFATAGAAGTDFGMNNRDAKDVQMGGLVGIALATIFAGGLAILIAAGAHGSGAAPSAALRATGLMDGIVGENTSKVFMYLLAIAAFPPACFSSFIAANSFKTTLPKINPFLSVGCGTAVSVLLAVTGLAGDVIGMFTIIGASFGPVCGSMAADYLLAGRKWAGPRAGFNLAGWIAWVAGFIVGAADFIPGMAGRVVCPPVMAFLVGFILYYLLAKLGMEGETLEMPDASEAATAKELAS
jgi:cytosine permease